jgi:peptide/nickel transport system ATP-binding protein
MPPGCPFAPRCPLHVPECDAAEPPLLQVGGGHTAACIRTEVVAKAGGDASAVFDETSTDTLLGGEAYPAELAASPEGAPDAEARSTPPPDQTEPTATSERQTGAPTTARGDLS